MQQSLNVDFKEAIDAAEARGVVLPDEYYNLLPEEARAIAFTVSQLTSATQIQDVLDTLNKRIAEGATQKEWVADLLKKDFGLTKARLQTIVRTHTQTAYLAGHHRKYQVSKVTRPYLMYSAINDARVRPTHFAMDGIIKPVDDSFWKTFFPPNGFNCRCSVISLNERQATKRGGVTSGVPDGAVVDDGWKHPPTLHAESADDALNDKRTEFDAALLRALDLLQVLRQRN